MKKVKLWLLFYHYAASLGIMLFSKNKAPLRVACPKRRLPFFLGTESLLFV